MKDYYHVLGIDKNAVQKEIKQAYRDSAKRFHPDSGNAEKDSKHFREVTEAYEVLSDNNKRLEYDKTLPGAVVQDSRTSVEPIRPTQPFYTGDYDPNPYMRDLPGDYLRFRSGRNTGPSLLKCVVRLSADEAKQDVTYPITVRAAGPCPTCGGLSGGMMGDCPDCLNKGVIYAEKELVINIPGGFDVGSEVRLELDHVGLPGVALVVEVIVS